MWNHRWNMIVYLKGPMFSPYLVQAPEHAAIIKNLPRCYCSPTFCRKLLRQILLLMNWRTQMKQYRHVPLVWQRMQGNPSLLTVPTVQLLLKAMTASCTDYVIQHSIATTISCNNNLWWMISSTNAMKNNADLYSRHTLHQWCTNFFGWGPLDVVLKPPQARSGGWLSVAPRKCHFH